MSGKVHVIAEAGTNHNADPETARRLIDVAAAAGADSVKFQIIYPEGLYLPRFFRDGQYVENEVFQKRAAGALRDDDYRALAGYCREKGLPLSASVFDKRGLDLLDALDAPYIKIASTDLNNSPLLVQAAERRRRLVISTGMSELSEIERAIEDVTRAGQRDLVLLHCVSVYPCATERMNLGFIQVLKSTFGFPVGLSDHTEHNVAALVALGLGVEWIEKHYTLDRTQDGFDHAYALEPAGFRAYVADIRAGSASLERPPEKVSAAEASTRARARRALYASRDIQAGAVLGENDVLIVRPQGPLSPNDLPLVLGKRATHDIKQFEPLSLASLA